MTCGVEDWRFLPTFLGFQTRDSLLAQPLCSQEESVLITNSKGHPSGKEPAVLTIGQEKGPQCLPDPNGVTCFRPAGGPLFLLWGPCQCLSGAGREKRNAGPGPGSTSGRKCVGSELNSSAPIPFLLCLIFTSLFICPSGKLTPTAQGYYGD